MELPFYQVDAFARTPFTGNPAAVVVLYSWLKDEVMQSIAAENNLSETAFIVPEGDKYLIRFFTPKVEVPICGHATLAAGHVALNYLQPQKNEVEFIAQNDSLKVIKDEEMLWLDFPAFGLEQTAAPEGLVEVMGKAPQEHIKTIYTMLVYNSQEEIEQLKPDFERLIPYDDVGVIATAPGKDVDFVSRFFCPAAGINEDPVTGSAHCGLIPYWAARLGKKNMTAKQLSERGGELFCEDRGDRVRIGGKAFTIIEGKMTLDCEVSKDKAA